MSNVELINQIVANTEPALNLITYTLSACGVTITFFVLASLLKGE